MQTRPSSFMVSVLVERHATVTCIGDGSNPFAHPSIAFLRQHAWKRIRPHIACWNRVNIENCIDRSTAATSGVRESARLRLPTLCCAAKSCDSGVDVLLRGEVAGVIAPHMGSHFVWNDREMVNPPRC